MKNIKLCIQPIQNKKTILNVLNFLKDICRFKFINLPENNEIDSNYLANLSQKILSIVEH